MVVADRATTYKSVLLPVIDIKHAFVEVQPSYVGVDQPS